jgi:hypothetical protein
LRDSEKVKVLQQKAIEHCDLPKGGNLNQAMVSKKKAMEIRYTNSASRLSFMGCALLTSSSRMVKQSLLETDDIVKRIDRLINLLSAEIEVRIMR